MVRVCRYLGGWGSGFCGVRGVVMSKRGQGREGVLRRLGVGERMEVPRGEHRRWDEAKSRVCDVGEIFAVCEWAGGEAVDVRERVHGVADWSRSDGRGR